MKTKKQTATADRASPQDIPELRHVLTVAAANAESKIPKATIRDAVYVGDIPHTRCGDTILFTREAFEWWRTNRPPRGPKPRKSREKKK